VGLTCSGKRINVPARNQTASVQSTAIHFTNTAILGHTEGHTNVQTDYLYFIVSEEKKQKILSEKYYHERPNILSVSA
jgi:hypothetical protein